MRMSTKCSRMKEDARATPVEAAIPGSGSYQPGPGILENQIVGIDLGASVTPVCYSLEQNVDLPNL